MKSILLVERDAAYRERAKSAFGPLHVAVHEVETSGDAVRAILDESPTMVIAGADEPLDDDIELLRLARSQTRPVPVLVLARHGTTRGAIGFMDAGAYDYVARPTDPRELLAAVQEILRLAGEEELAPPMAANTVEVAGEIVGRSPEMIEICKMIGRIAKSDAAVLVQGESGTGKELVARAIHENSRRAGKPFLAVNCAAIPETLLESELFGHEKGAFTGATYSRKGKFELSHGGTIFLDEVGDMSLATQAKILRVLQEHTFERVGGEQTLSADTRLIAATNKSLVVQIEKGEFRVDLFYRLKVVSIFLPALRKRPGDVPLLVDHFVKKYEQLAKVPIRGVAQRARALLEAQPWTGNIRELENAIQTGIVLNRTGTLDVEDFPFLHESATSSGRETVAEALSRLGEEARRTAGILLAHGDASRPGVVYHRCLDSVERSLVDAALGYCAGNQVRAARALGISRNTLRGKMSVPSVDPTPRPS
ncbi:MAG: sigma-54 dependent transcriptional regulator [bacterium]